MLLDPTLGDGLKDATGPIREIIREINTRAGSSPTWLQGGALEISSGIYRITDTIRLHDGVGFKVAGNGTATRKIRILPQGGPWLAAPFEFLATAFAWDGPDDGRPMFEASGNGASFRDFSLWGGGAGIGIHFRNDPSRKQRRPGIATGHGSIDNVTGSHLAVGFQFGNDFADGNLGDIIYGRVEFYRCGAGIRAVNSMSLNHRIGYIQGSRCGTILDFEAGGKVDVGLLSSEGCGTILRCNRQGNGNEIFTVSQIALDANHFIMPRIVDHQNDRGDLTVRIGNLHAPARLLGRPRLPGDPIFRIGARGRVLLESGQYIRPEYLDAPGLYHRHVKTSWP